MPELTTEQIPFVDQTPRYKHETEMILALRDHFGSKEYLVLPQVRNDAAFRSNRTADALVCGTWPSRGLDMFGIEIKVSRADWLRELKDPKKADDIGKYCDFWVLAVGDESLVKLDELPTTWGLLVPGKKPNTLRMKVQPTRNQEVKPITRGFLVMILGKCLQVTTPLADIDAEISRRVAAITASLEQSLTERLTKEFDAHGLMAKNKKLKEAAEAFRKETGVYLTAESAPDYRSIGKAIHALQYIGLDGWLKRTEKDIKNTLEDFQRLRESLPDELRDKDQEPA